MHLNKKINNKKVRQKKNLKNGNYMYTIYL